jgi:GT2 family glycosyltransferase
MRSPRVSVVIPTYNRRDLVERALRALARQDYPQADFEVVVSVDGSEDGTRERVERFAAPFEVRAAWQPKKGRASACNAGIRAARGELVVLLDDDMEPVPGFLTAHVLAHADGSRRGVVGAVPVVIDRESSPVTEYIGLRFHRHLEKLARPDHRIGARDFYSGNFSISREILQEVGSFDEDFQDYGNEDGELALRLITAGVKLTFSPEALAWQHYEKDFTALAHDKLAQGQTSVKCALRHPESVPSLRIGTYRRGGLKWRLLRNSLIAASRLLRFLPNMVLGYVKWLERHRSPKLLHRYDMALDYFYWLGVRSALRENPGAAARLAL